MKTYNPGKWKPELRIGLGLVNDCHPVDRWEMRIIIDKFIRRMPPPYSNPPADYHEPNPRNRTILDLLKAGF